MTDVALPINKDNKRYAREYWRKIGGNRQIIHLHKLAKIHFYKVGILKGGEKGGCYELPSKVQRSTVADYSISFSFSSHFHYFHLCKNQ